MILAGILVGPNGFNILMRDSSIVLFGTVGLLYIMFLAGLELDMNEFRKSRNRSVILGLLTFSIPMFIGLPICYYLLDFDIVASVLISSMRSEEHTSELQSLMRISYAVFCFKKKNK